MALAPDITKHDLDALMVLADDVRADIIEAQKMITQAFTAPALQTQLDTLATCAQQLARATAAAERLESRPQHTTVESTLDDILCLLQQRPPAWRRPWWLAGTVLTMVGLLGLLAGWQSARWAQRDVRLTSAACVERPGPGVSPLPGPQKGGRR